MQARTGQVHRPARPTGLVVTATTLMAMVAMSSAAVPVSRDVETRLEPHVVRAVAAAVAAVARDLLVVEHTTVALVEPVLDALPAGAGRPIAQTTATAVSTALLSERLLDLPPPTG